MTGRVVLVVALRPGYGYGYGYGFRYGYGYCVSYSSSLMCTAVCVLKSVRRFGAEHA